MTHRVTRAALRFQNSIYRLAGCKIDFGSAASLFTRRSGYCAMCNTWRWVNRFFRFFYPTSKGVRIFIRLRDFLKARGCLCVWLCVCFLRKRVCLHDSCISISIVTLTELIFNVRSTYVRSTLCASRSRKFFSFRLRNP